MSDIRKLKQTSNKDNNEMADVLVDNLDYGGSKGFYKRDEIYRPFTIYGNGEFFFLTKISLKINSFDSFFIFHSLCNLLYYLGLF